VVVDGDADVVLFAQTLQQLKAVGCRTRSEIADSGFFGEFEIGADASFVVRIIVDAEGRDRNAVIPVQPDHLIFFPFPDSAMFEEKFERIEPAFLKHADDLIVRKFAETVTLHTDMNSVGQHQHDRRLPDS